MSRPLAEIEAELIEVERAWSAYHANATEGLSGHLGSGVGVGRGAAQVRAGGQGYLGDGRPGGVGRSGGNPYHDAEGKFASGPGGGHAARRARRKRRIRRKARALKARHKAERIAVATKQRERHAKHKEYYTRKTANLHQRQARELEHMDKKHARELERHDRQVADSHAENDRQLAAGHVSEEHHARRREALEGSSKWIREANQQERETRKQWHQGERNTLRDERREAIATLKDRHALERRKTLKRQAAEKEEFREEHGLQPREAKRGFVGCGIAEITGKTSRDIDGAVHHRSAGADRGETRQAVGVGGKRFHSGRTHKAGNAESILAACLRRLGFTTRWKAGRLTGKQALRLLAAVRDYARAWLHHECEQLIRQHGRVIDEATTEATWPNEEGENPLFPRMLGILGEVGDIGLRPHHDQSGERGGSPAIGRGGLQGSEGLLGPEAPGSLSGVAGNTNVERGLSSAIRKHVGRFFDRARTFVREAIVAGAMALAGPGGLTADDLDEADRQAGVQVAFLDQFHRDVEARGPAELSESSVFPVEGAMSAAEMAARAEMYGSSAWQGAMQVNRRGVIKDGRAVRERRFHRKPNPEGHACTTCLEQSSFGWVPVGTLLPIGDAECLTNCDCYFVYELADGSVFITRRGWQRRAG